MEAPQTKNLNLEELKNEAENQKETFWVSAFNEFTKEWMPQPGDEPPKWIERVLIHTMAEAMYVTDTLVGTLIPENEREKAKWIMLIGVWWAMRNELKKRIDEGRFWEL